jgi:hypothetical protein
MKFRESAVSRSSPTPSKDGAEKTE